MATTRLSGVLLACLVVVAGALALSASAAQQTPKRGGTFVMALSSDVSTLDPAHAGYDFASWSATIALYSSLVDYNRGLKIRGDLASSWKVSNGGKTYTFRLRPHVVFSDGSPLTSSDVGYTVERILAPKTASEGAWIFGGVVGSDAFAKGKAAHVAGVSTPNPSTVVFRLKTPESYFLNLLAMPYARVVKQSQVGKYGSAFSSHPLGSGPFVLQKWTHGQEMVLVRNPKYFAPGVPSLDKVSILLNQNDQTRILAFQRNQLSISDVPSAAFAQFTGDPRYKPYLISNVDPDTYFIGMKANEPPFDKLPVRQAMNYAVNKQRLIQLQNGLATVANGVIPPTMPGYNPRLAGYSYDPAKARALLSQAGYPNGFSTELWTKNDELSTRIVQSVANDLAAVGVKVSIHAVDSSAFYSNVGKVPMYFRRWWQDFPDPYDFFSNLLTKAQWGPNNAAYYYNPVVDKGVARASSMQNAGARARLWRSLDQTVSSDAPWIFLYHTRTVNVRQPNVHFYLHPVHIWRFADYSIG
jgi:peptide/nickel transport system substrate-binding protein